MNGLDQVIIALWFLPVMLVIIVPLLAGLVWTPISFLARFIQRELDREGQFKSEIAEARATV